MKRITELKKAKEIYEKMSKEGVYRPEEVKEGWMLIYPDSEPPSGFAMRRQFVGFFQYLYADVLEQLELLFEEPHKDDSLDFDNAEPTHEEQLEVDDQMELDLKVTKTTKVPVKNIKLPKKKRVSKKKK